MTRYVFQQRKVPEPWAFSVDFEGAHMVLISIYHVWLFGGVFKVVYQFSDIYELANYITWLIEKHLGLDCVSSDAVQIEKELLELKGFENV